VIRIGGVLEEGLAPGALIGFQVVRLVGVVVECEPPIRLLDFVRRRISGQAEDFVVGRHDVLRYTVLD